MRRLHNDSLFRGIGLRANIQIGCAVVVMHGGKVLALDFFRMMGLGHPQLCVGEE